MIKDEQGKQWILKKLHDKGYKYLYIDSWDYEVTASDILPEVNEHGQAENSCDANKCRPITLEDLIDIEKSYIDIEKYLGIVDWDKVPVDTPVIVWNNGIEKEHKQYFAKYENGKVHTWCYGATSWSKPNLETHIWDNARLANVDKE